MKSDANIRQHNYVTKIQRMWDTGDLPREAGYHQISVSHDEWCGLWQQARCNCDPDIQWTFSLGDQIEN